MRKIIPAVAAGAAALTLAGGTYGYAMLDKSVSLSVDGAATDVSTTAGTVGQLLQSKGIDIGAHDVVAPGLETDLVEGTQVSVRYGRQVTVTVDGKPRTFWTTATDVGSALATLRVDATGAALSTSRSAAIGRQGLAFALTTRKTITIADAGAKRQLRTTAPTVGAALKAARVTVDADDRLSANPNTRLTNGATLTITRVQVAKVTTTKKVGHKTTYTDSKQLDRGDTKVKTDGKAGVRTTVYTEVRHNGKLRTRTPVSSKITTAPRTEVVLRGTRDPQPEPRYARNDSSNNNSRNDSSNNNSSGNNRSNNNDRSNSSDGNGSSSGSRSVSSSGGDRATAFITGYTWWDNSPPGSAQIARPVIHERAGGTGTYSDPITVAVASGRFPFGTRFYLPEFKKYFIVEDICGACGRSRSGASYTLDIWLDGRNSSSSGARDCSYRVTGTTPAIRKPSRGLPVDAGSVC